MTITAPWMRWVLRIAALYNMGWGFWAMFAPGAVFALFGVDTPTYLELWQGIGLSTAILGMGQMLASRDPYKHWIVVLIGLLESICVPFGFWQGVQRGHLPASALWMVGMNDLVWWIPFAVILWKTYDFNRTRRILASPEVQRFALRAKSQHGVSILEMSQLSPTMIVFLRHLGCTFCRETLADLRIQRTKLEVDGVRVVLVHMASESQAEVFFEKYGLQDIPRVSDPSQGIYRAFGLDRGSLLQLFGLKTWIRGFRTSVVDGHAQGATVGDSFQMPGVFLIFHGEVLRAYRHQSPADRPNYVSLAQSQDYPIPS